MEASHFPFLLLNAKQENCEYQFSCFLFDPTWNLSRVYRFSSRRFIRSTTDQYAIGTLRVYYCMLLLIGFAISSSCLLLALPEVSLR